MLGLVVCDVKDHVTEFAFVPQIDRILSTDRSVLFIGRQLFVFVECHPSLRSVSLKAIARESARAISDLKRRRVVSFTAVELCATRDLHSRQ